MTTASDFFWQLATPLLEDEAITKSTMMWFPCLRVNGDFFASAEKETGHLLVKLPKTRVQDMIDSEQGDPFAPNGRRFKEWVLVTNRDGATWQALMRDARAFVEGK